MQTYFPCMSPDPRVRQVDVRLAERGICVPEFSSKDGLI